MMIARNSLEFVKAESECERERESIIIIQIYLYVVHMDARYLPLSTNLPILSHDSRLDLSQSAWEKIARTVSNTTWT